MLHCTRYAKSKLFPLDSNLLTNKFPFVLKCFLKFLSGLLNINVTLQRISGVELILFDRISVMSKMHMSV